MDNFKTITKARLELIGYSVLEIPEGPGDSADLRATIDSEALVVEVKSRIEDEVIDQKLREAAEGVVISHSADLERQTPLSRIIHKAMKQIQASKSACNELAVLWFYPDPKLGLADAPIQIEANLLGTRWILAKWDNDFNFAPCYLAGRTDFHKYPDLDMAVIDSSEGSKLFINPYSKRLNDVRQTKLFRYFDNEGAVVDLYRIHTGYDVFVIFGDFDRSDDKAILSELEKQYPGVCFSFCNMQSIGGYTKFEQT